MHIAHVFMWLGLFNLLGFGYGPGGKQEWTGFRGLNSMGIDTQWSAPTSWDA